ncbi:MAG TPA: MMPL family transporter [Thermoanaerobaculia bacterium]|nr:MMPL family transporter [Thermoanaerobaculia bacterium]
MFDRYLEALARFCLRHSKGIAIGAVVATVLGLAAASRLSFDPEILNLIPQNNREVNEFRKVLHDLGTLDNHVVVVNIPPGADVSTYDPLIASIAEGYRRSSRIDEVHYRIPNPLDFVEEILPSALLFMTPEQLDVVALKLSDAGIRESVARNRTILQTPQSFAVKQLVRYDPFNLAPILMEKFQSAGGGIRIDTASGYYLSADRTMLLILTRPNRPAQDVPFAKELLAEGAAIEARALREFRQTAPPGTPLPRIEHTGGYRIAADDANLIRQDVIVNVLTSFFGVLLLFVISFRRVAAIFYAAAPMVVGLAITFGVAGVVYGILSSASAGFAALLAGLGIDFISVIYGRYVDERNRGAAMAEAIVTSIRATYRGVALAAITTAATFYGFLATDFRGMTQLGFLTGTGILFFVVAVALLVPALIVLSETRNRKRGPRLFHNSFGSEHLVERAMRRPRLTIALWVVFTLVFGALATRIRFSDNVQDLRAKGNAGVINQEKVTRKFGQSFEFMMYVISDRSLDRVLERTHAVTQELRPLVADGTIASFQSIASFIPPREQQLAVIRELERGRADRFDIDRIAKTFRAALVENGFRPDAYDSYLPLFARALAPTGPVTIDEIRNEELLSFTTRYVKRTNDHWMSVIYLYPAGGRWPREVPPRLMALNDLRREEILTGINLVSGTLRRIVRADAIRSTAIGLAVVTLLIFLGFRSVKMTVLTFVPLLSGTAGMMGLMALLGLEFNFMNVFVGLMLVGVATDYAVYMLHRYIEDPPSYHDSAVETSKAVVMAALTTIVGYGSFALSHYPGLRSIGYASTFGILFSGLAAITLIPAILTLGRKRHDA